LGGVGDRTKAGLPDDTKIPGFTALLPVVEELQPHVADIVISERGDRFVVNAVEQVGTVWRMALLQAVS
jgi:hypothetical protein